MAAQESSWDIFLSTKLHLGISVTRARIVILFITYSPYIYTPVQFIFFDLLVSYGRPGVELSARHQQETVIQELHFLPEQVSNQRLLDHLLVVFIILRLQSTEGKIKGVFCRVGLCNEITWENSAYYSWKMLDFCRRLWNIVDWNLLFFAETAFTYESGSVLAQEIKIQAYLFCLARE